MDRKCEVIVRGIVAFVGPTLELNKFSLISGKMQSVRFHISFDLSRFLVPWAWIPFNTEYDWIEFKYEGLPNFYYYCCKITHQSRFCLNFNGINIEFEGKHAMFGEWIRAGMNMKVPPHVKNGGVKKK